MKQKTSVKKLASKPKKSAAKSTPAADPATPPIPVLAQQDAAAVLAAFATIKSKLPFLLSLSVEASRSLFRMGEARVSFVQNAEQVSGSHPEIMAGTFSNADFTARMALVAALQPIVNASAETDKMIADTSDSYGAAAMQDALEVYRSLQQAVKKNAALQPALDQLSDLFKRTKAAAPQPANLASGKKSE